MTITLTHTGGNVTLCDGADYAGTAGKFIGPLGEGMADTEWAVNLRKYIGAASASPKALGNAAHSFSLSVFVAFATEAEATAFRLGRAALMQHDGATLVCVEGAATITYSPACITKLRITQQGVGCTADYTFACGVPVVTETEE